MKEVLNNQQIVCPGDATQFMHAIFSSDHEMMTFYLTLKSFYKSSQLFGGTLGSAKTGRFRECSFW